MKGAAFLKSSRRTVKSTMTRFISIALISFLGAGIFAGLGAVAPNMKRVGNEYYDRHNVMDVRMLSTYGFSEEDVEAIKNTEGVSGVMASYMADATGTVGDKDYTFRVNGLPESADTGSTDYVNQLNLIEGKWPEKGNEAIIIRPSIGLKNIKLNSAVRLDEDSNDSLPDTLRQTDYTIVGIAESPYYLSFMQGNTSVGNGSIDYILYVPQENFIVDGYTDLYVTIQGAKEKNAFEESYFDFIKPTVQRLETLANAREGLRYDQFQAELTDAKKEYADKQKETEDKLSEAESKLAEGKATLADAKKEYNNGLAEYHSKQAEAEDKLADAKAQLSTAWNNIKEGEQQLSVKQKEYNTGKTKLKEARTKLDTGWSEYRSKALELSGQEAKLADSKKELDKAQAQYEKGVEEAENSTGISMEEMEDSLPSTLESSKAELAEKWKEYNAAVVKIKQAKQELAVVKSKLESSEKEYSGKAAELSSAETQLSKAEKELATAKQSYQEGISEYNSKKAEAEQKFAEAKTELDRAEVEIADGEKELTDKQQEYEDKKEEADSKLSDAKEEIETAEEKLSDLGEPKWYVLDRNLNESFVTFKDDTERMHDLATVFPVIFFLVAALVCLTTMTRMVDEDRTLIGTFKALGYSNGKIAGRYLKYAASASLLGSIAGVLLGFWLLPTIIWNAYGIVFALPKLIPAFYYGIAFLSIFSTVFIITLATGVAAKKSLGESPAELMRPKAPKSGKRVFLEYIKPVWNRLSFTKKVTVRNLGLNKKRLLMTLIGVLGCTALVVTAFGAKNAVRTLLDKQFGGIFHYNVSVGFNGEKASDELVALLKQKEYFQETGEVLRKSAEASLTEEDNETNNIYVVAVKEEDNFSKLVTLTDPETKENIEMDKNSVIITEKLSINLNVKVGDSIKVKYLDDNKYHVVKITGITMNYAFNYLYLGRDAYRESFGESPVYNQFFVIAENSHSKDEIKEYLSSAAGVGVISFTDDLMGNIRTSINSVNNIIWILIIAAGLLAFVVLYNLTNINIGERQRELATLKVLGFYDKETYSYIFREINILSVIGCLTGLFGGIFLYRAVVSTVEPDMILLTRDLTWEGYLGAAILTMLFSWIVNQCMKPRIKNIDMLESLKSVD